VADISGWGDASAAAPNTGGGWGDPGSESGEGTPAAAVVENTAYVAPVMLTKEERAEKLKRALAKVGPVTSRASLREAADKVTRPTFQYSSKRGENTFSGS
jgi:hypothetical protein